MVTRVTRGSRFESWQDDFRFRWGRLRRLSRSGESRFRARPRGASARWGPPRTSGRRTWSCRRRRTSASTPSNEISIGSFGLSLTAASSVDSWRLATARDASCCCCCSASQPMSMFSVTLPLVWRPCRCTWQTFCRLKFFGGSRWSDLTSAELKGDWRRPLAFSRVVDVNGLLANVPHHQEERCYSLLKRKTRRPCESDSTKMERTAQIWKQVYRTAKIIFKCEAATDLTGKNRERIPRIS